MPLDDNVAVYDEVGHLLILLNVGATAIWEGCDGVATFDEIVAGLAATHDGDIEVIAKDAWHTVRKLTELGLVEEPAEEPAAESAES